LIYSKDSSAGPGLAPVRSAYEWLIKREFQCELLPKTGCIGMAILDELYIHVGEAHQYYKYFLRKGMLGGKHKYYTCKHWNPSCDMIDLQVSTGPHDIWLLVCTDCYYFDWGVLEEQI